MSLFTPGLVSGSFKKLSPQEIVSLVVKSGLKCLEWGGDIHAPHGNIQLARSVGRITKEAGLETVSYGSYYRVGHSEDEGLSFESVLDTARALEAQTIRVWAGTRDSETADDAYITKIAEDARRIAEFAAMTGIRVAFEYHGGTVANTAGSVLHLLKLASSANLFSLWQPALNVSVENRLDALTKLIPYLSHIHVFQWQDVARLPLAAGTEEWLLYLETLKIHSVEIPLLLEFVQNDSVEQLAQDAKVLMEWIEAVSP
jgi:sugar phosphate isomerase/epimerase